MPPPNGPSARAIPGIGMSVRIAATIRTTIPRAGTRQLGLPAAPGEADEQGERGHRSAPGFAPPAAECSGDVRERGHRSAPGGAPPASECTGDVAAGNTSAAPVASRAGAQAPRHRTCRRATAAVGVERKRVAVSGTLLRYRCCSRRRCGSRCRLRRAVIGTMTLLHNFCRRRMSRHRHRHRRPRRSWLQRSRGTPLRARRNHSGMIRLRSCRPARCRRPRCCTRSASAS